MPQLFVLTSQSFGSPVLSKSGLLSLIVFMSAFFANSAHAIFAEIEFSALFCKWMSTLATGFSELPVQPAIMDLLLSGGPPAVFLFIVAFIIGPIKFQSLARMWAHVLLKNLKGRAPLGADRDSSGAVPLERNASGIMAAINHRPPSLVERLSRLVLKWHSQQNSWNP